MTITLPLDRVRLHLEKDETIQPWLEYFVNLNCQQLDIALKTANESKVDKLLSSNQSAVWQFVQTRDEVAIREVVEAPKNTTSDGRTIS